MNGANALHPLGFMPGWEPDGLRGVRPQPIEAKKRGVNGAASARVIAPETETAEARIRASSLLKPPPPVLQDVDARSAARAWDAVFGALSGSLRTASAAIRNDEQAVEVALKDLGSATTSLHEFYRRVLNPETVLLEFQLESTTFAAEMTKANLDHASELRKAEVAAIEEMQRKQQEAAEKQKEIEHKAGKGQIAALVLSWATSVAQVVTGALKIATGQPQGALDLTAGLLGIAKCTLQSIEMAHPELTGKLRSHIDELAKWETGFSVAAGVTSVFTAARMAKAANAILGKAAGNLLTTGVEVGGSRVSSVGVTLVRAFDQGGDAAAAAKQLVKNIAQTVADDVGAQVRNSIRIFGGSERAVEVFAKGFSNKAIQEMVERSLLQVAQQMRGVSTEVLQTAFIQQVQAKVMWSAFRAAVSVTAMLDAPLNSMKLAATTTQQITSSALRIEAANKKEEIDRLMIRAMMLQFVIDLIANQIKENKNALERVTQDHVDNTEKITGAIGEIRDVALDAVSSV